MRDYLLAVGLITALMLGWIAVQRIARRFAARHPEFGPAREEGAGCGLGCRCTGARHCGGALRERAKERLP